MRKRNILELGPFFPGPNPKQSQKDFILFSVSLKKGKSSIYSNPDWLYTSVGNNVLEQRISRLSQYIVEAQWRYQLVSWNGDHKSESSPKGRPKFNQQSSSLTQERVHLKMTPGDKQQSGMFGQNTCILE